MSVVVIAVNTILTQCIADKWEAAHRTSWKISEWCFSRFYLVYLPMTISLRPTVSFLDVWSPTSSLTYSGVVPAPPGQASYDGTIALSKKSTWHDWLWQWSCWSHLPKVFLEDWLLKKLELLNQATSFVVDEVKMDNDIPNLSIWYCKKMSFHTGLNDGEVCFQVNLL